MAMRHIESREGLGQFVNDTDWEKASLARLMVEGAKLWAARYPDIPFPIQSTSGEPTITEQTQRQNPLQQEIAELKKESTPESVTNYWRAKLQVDGARAGLVVDVPDCDWTEKEIKRPMVDIKGNPVAGMMVYKPEQFKGKEGLILLGKMYPQMASYSVREDTPITDMHETTGWVKVEAAIDAPNRNTRQKELEDFAKEQGYFGQRENTYILASQASKDLNGQYFDEDEIWSRLLASRGGGGVVGAFFNSDGDLGVSSVLDPQARHPDLGARFEEVKKT